MDYNALMQIVNNQRSTITMLDSLKSTAYSAEDYACVDKLQSLIDSTYNDLKTTEQMLSDELNIGNPLFGN